MSLLVLFNNNGAAPTAYVLDTTVGSFTVAGQSAELLVNRQSQTTVGTYSVNGQTATTEYNRRLTTTPEAFTITGFSANLNYVSSRYYRYDGSNWILLTKNPQYWTGSAWQEITNPPTKY